MESVKYPVSIFTNLFMESGEGVAVAKAGLIGLLLLGSKFSYLRVSLTVFKFLRVKFSLDLELY